MAVELAKVFEEGRMPLPGRLAISVGCALLYGPMIGLPVSAAWALAYTLLQVAEDRLIAGPKAADSRRWLALGLLASQSAMFGAPALLLLERTGPWGVGVGTMHLSAALFIFSMHTQRSRAAFLAAATPLVAHMAAFVLFARLAGAPLTHSAMMAGGFVLVILATILSWTQGTRALRSKEVAIAEAVQLRRHAEEDAVRLTEANRLADLAAHAAGLGYWRYGPGLQRLVWSKEVFGIFGRDEIDGSPDIETALNHFPPADRQRVESAFDAALAQGAPFDFEAHLIRDDGEERIVAVKGLAEPSRSGAETFVIGTILDVTSARRAALKLAESEELFQELARNTSDILVRTGTDGRLEYVSPAAEIITGYTPEELIGGKTILTICEEDRPILLDAVKRAAQSHGPSLAGRVEYRRLHKDGRTLWFESCPTPVRDPATGALTGIIDAVRDVTARKALEADLMAAREHAEQLAAIKSEFLATMSHELRTPLTSIVGFSALVRDRPGLDAEARRYLDRVSTAADALMTTVNDILDFSKLEAGQLDIKPEPIDFGRMVAETLALLGPQADAKDLELVDESQAILGRTFLLDPARLRQVILNFLSNAVKFTDDGSVTITSSLSPDQSRLTCSVVDTGLGVPPDQLKKLFKRFSQLDGAAYRAKGGSGLGLAICKGLIEAMGGEIGVESQAGRGSRFWFSLPVTEVAAAQSPADSAEDDRPLLDGVHILVVDDNDSNRDLVRALLAPLGAQCHGEASGEGALKTARELPFDLILLDLRMPGMDGHETLRALRDTDGPNRHTPVLAFSADVTADTTPAMAAEGFAGAVSKPINLGQFLRVVSRLTDDAADCAA